MPEQSARVQFARYIASRVEALHLYGILDAEACARRNLDPIDVAEAWKAACIRTIQYRDKLSTASEIEARAVALRALFPPDSGTWLILNDDPEMAVRCAFDGVHVGQTDAAVSEARHVVGPGRIIGVSTHSVQQAEQAQRTDCDYIAIGPVFTTASKVNAAPVVGVCGVQAVRAIVRKPLVAIGGIDSASAKHVLDAGADTVAIISGLLPDPNQSSRGNTVQELQSYAQDFLLRLK